MDKYIFNYDKMYILILMIKIKKMNKNIFVLLMIVFVLSSISAISATNLDGQLEINDNSVIQENSIQNLQLNDNADDSSKNTVYGEDVVKVFKNDTQYFATFMDNEGNYLKNGTVVHFEVNDMLYDRQVGDNGMAKLNINLPQGDYVINTTNPVTNESIINSIKVISRLVENNQLTKCYKNDAPYSVKVLDDVGNPVGEGTEVNFNIGGVFYTAKTNEQGIANLGIDFVPGGYVVTAEYYGCKVSNYIMILPILYARDLNMKYLDGSQFIATLYDDLNRPLANNTVRFYINGVRYDRTTDEVGQAKLNINLVEGVYGITTSYGETEITNKITVERNPNNNLLFSGKIGTYEELIKKIYYLSPGDVLTLDMDYAFENTGRNIFQVINGRTCVVEKYSRGIDITTDNITIDGNGYTIDGKSKAAIFNVMANNVTIKNLNIINGHDISNFKAGSLSVNMEYTESPVRWSGDNGILLNCTVSDNMAFIGGAISWTGSNGTICNINFINNTARGVGGAIYVNATNNRIFNSTFRNCHSLLTGEALYYDRMRHNCTLESVDFGNGTYIDGSISDFDLNYLYYAYYSSVADLFFNLIPVLFLSINCNGTSLYLDENTSFSSKFNKTDFVLTFNRNLGDNVILAKEYYFTNVTSWNDIFAKLFDSNFKNKFILLKNFYIDENNLLNSYNQARNTKVSILSPYLKYCEAACGLALSLVLNVEFPEHAIIYSKDSWNIIHSGFDIVSIQGHGSQISASSGDRDENKWIILEKGCVFSATNILITRFNTVIENNGGYCIFDNVSFCNNRMDYWFDRDWGAAILNTGVCICNKCYFGQNYAKNGGAIFNQGYLVLDNCTFVDNGAYGKGDNVCNANGGVVFFDGEEIKQSTKYVTCVGSISSGWQTIIKISAFALSFLAGFVAGYITANPMIGMAVGGLIGAGLGLGSSAIIIAFSYDAKMDRLGLATRMTFGCMAVGILGGVLGSTVSPYGPAQFEVDAGAVAEGNPEIVEFIDAPMEAGQGFIGPDMGAISEFSDIASNSGSILSNVAEFVSESASEISSVIGDISFITV